MAAQSPCSGRYRVVFSGVDFASAANFAAASPFESPGLSTQTAAAALTAVEAALWAFSTTADFASGCLRAVNLGGDADTIAAIYGQFAGAYYGLEGIPSAWRDRVMQCDRLLELGRGLYALQLELERQ